VKVSPTEWVVLAVLATIDVSADAKLGPTWLAGEADWAADACPTADNTRVLSGSAETSTMAANAKIPRNERRVRTNRGILATPRLGSS